MGAFYRMIKSMEQRACHAPDLEFLRQINGTSMRAVAIRRAGITWPC